MSDVPLSGERGQLNLEKEEEIARGVLLAVLARHADIEYISAKLLVGCGGQFMHRIASGLDFSIRDTALRRATRAVLQREMTALGWRFEPGGDVIDIRLASVARSEASAHELASALRRFAT